MAFPYDELDPREVILLDTNPTFGRLIWPLLELMVITGVCWLLIGFIDSPNIAPGDMQGVRQLLMLAWLLLILWRVVRPVFRWLGERFVLTDRRIILRRGVLRPQVVSIDLRSVRAVNRKGAVLYLHTRHYGPPLAVEDIPSTRKVAKLVSRLT
ncbi:MAG: PH domain-containing protein [Corynebacterium sp.]|uniref:PH domain-containing protein n=1 Tax=Corynebacterium sp. TaxID=1720 RepID=UPI0026DC2653|nr:PH domain-containing protein [Corynebacterium sp.]MDO5030514.1 PH domain-containing protein [Corynebacterium sp.]